MKLEIKKLHPKAQVPSYANPGDAGMDLHACLEESFSLNPGEKRLVKTGIAIALPPGTEAQIRPRSGLAFKMGVTVLNSPGTIDEGYRGEIGVILINHGKNPVNFINGARIAQIVIKPVIRAEVFEVEELSETERGEGGFGSTGV